MQLDRFLLYKNNIISWQKFALRYIGESEVCVVFAILGISYLAWFHPLAGIYWYQHWFGCFVWVAVVPMVGLSVTPPSGSFFPSIDVSWCFHRERKCDWISPHQGCHLKSIHRNMANWGHPLLHLRFGNQLLMGLVGFPCF